MPPRRPSPDSLLHAESLAFGCSCGRHRQLGISTRRVGDQAPGPCCRQSGRGEPRQPPCQPSPGRLPSRRPSSSCRSPTAQTHRRPPRGAHCMDCQVFHLAPAFELEPHQVTEVLRLLLHTIIFQRALGPVKPQERDSELFDVTWVRVSGAAATYAEGLAGRRKAGRAPAAPSPRRRLVSRRSAAVHAGAASRRALFRPAAPRRAHNLAARTCPSLVTRGAAAPSARAGRVRRRRGVSPRGRAHRPVPRLAAAQPGQARAGAHAPGRLAVAGSRRAGGPPATMHRPCWPNATGRGALHDGRPPPTSVSNNPVFAARLFPPGLPELLRKAAAPELVQVRCWVPGQARCVTCMH